MAGMATLVRQRFPNYTPAQVVSYLKDNAQQRISSPDPNNTWGHGFFVLPAITQPTPNLLGAPVIASVTPGTGLLTVSWRVPNQTGGLGITAYDLRHIRSDAHSKADANWTVARRVSTGSGILSHTLTGLAGGARYDVQVRAVNSAGEGPWSATVTGTTTASVGLPGAPGNLTATGNGQTSIHLSWSAPSNDGGARVVAYRIEVSTNRSSWSNLVSNTGSTSTGYSHTGLTAGATRHYRVSAINSTGTGSASNVATATTGTAPAPDLVVNTPSVSASAPEAGARFTLNATVRNQGNGSSASTTLRYHQSGDSTITNGDTEADTDYVSRLGAGESGYESVSLTAPSTPGTYYYGACVEAVSGESDTLNNCSSAVAVNVGAAPAPDLVVDTPTVSASAPEAGARFTLDTTVRNQGNGSSASTTLRYYQSGGSTISTGDTEVGTDSVFRLDAGESGDEEVSLTAPSTPGTYYYGACVEAVSGESDTQNNCSSAAAVNVGAAPAPDLVVDTPTVSASAPEAGERFTLNATVRNQGNGSSASTTLRYYQSGDSTISTGDPEADTDYVSRLDAGESGDESVSLTAPSTPGTYYYGACVEEVSGESDTQNNCSSALAVNVGAAPAPDLVVDRPGVSESAPETGARFTLNAMVRNQGNGSSASTTLRYYQSSDSTITTGDTEVDTDSVFRLDSGESGDESVRLTAPSSPGTYYYGACVDSTSGESNTQNNCSRAVTVTIAAVASVPGSPTGLTATANGQTRIDLSWSAPSDNGGADITGYRIEVSENGSSWTTRATNTGNTATSYSHSDLTAESTRHYRVSTINSVGTGQPSNTANATTSQAAQGSPDLVVDNTLLGANVTPGYNLSLNATVRNQGDGPSGPTTMHYYHSPDTLITTSDTPVGTDRVDRLVASGSIRHAISVTVPSTPGTYYYGACVDTVPSESDAGNNCSTAMEVTVRVVNSPPEVTGDIDDITVTLGESFRVDISGVFTEPDGEEIQNYGFTLRTSGILSGTVHTQTGILNLRAIGVGATTVAVEASDIHGNGSGPHDLFMVTVVPAETTTAPGAPAGLTATADGQTEIDLLWTAPSDDGGDDITGYRIEVSENGSSWTNLAVNTGNTATSYSHTGLTAGSTRHYRVSAINSAGTGSASNTANATTDAQQDTSACASDGAVPDAANNPGLVSDCEALLAAKDMLRGTATLNWAADVPMNQWEGIIVYPGTTLRRVTWIALEKNLTGAIPAGLSNLTELDRLALPNNQLTGEIPSELGGLSSLTELNLSNNRLGGNIPPELGNLAGLKGMTLTRNQLTGAIPTKLGDLASLQSLRLSDNKLSGAIPSELGNLGSLTSLTLSNNGLNGPIPSELGSLSRLVTLSVSDNELTGDIPPELGRLTRLSRFDFINNQLSGEIPSELGDLSSLTLLYLAQNRLTGDVPSELGNLGKLEELFLYGNQLTGCVPATLESQLDRSTLWAVWLPFCTTATASGAPTGLAATADGQTNVDLSWTAPSDDGGADITGYRIEVSMDNSTWSDLVADTGSTSTGYSHTGLSAGSTRYYRISAINSAGTGPASDTDSATTDAATKPGKPTGLTATADGQTEIDLSWTAPSDDGGADITGYRIDASTDGSSWSNLVANTSSSGTSYSHTGLSPGSTRHYRVSAINSEGTGPASGADSATTAAATKPGKPTGLTATADGETEIDLSWTAPSDEGGADITGYRIEASTDGSSWSNLVANTSSTSTGYSHSGLSAGSTRHYRVSAINSEGTGPASDADSATTDAAAPPATDGTCIVNLIVSPGESCTYPGTSDDFSVASDGTGHFLYISAGSKIELRNSTINGVTYTFVASKQSDGTWRVEEVG